jgi:quercetin dioxygenase-like cupin family protein
MAVAGFCAGLAVAAATQATERVQLLDNAHARVWRRTIAPGGDVAQHRHDHPRIVIPLSGGTMVFTDSDGAVSTQQWQAGKAYWLPAQAPGTTHAEANRGAAPIDLVAVELLDVGPD